MPSLVVAKSLISLEIGPPPRSVKDPACEVPIAVGDGNTRRSQTGATAKEDVTEQRQRNDFEITATEREECAKKLHDRCTGVLLFYLREITMKKILFGTAIVFARVLVTLLLVHTMATSQTAHAMQPNCRADCRLESL
jgi:hypothetical protein